MLNHVKMWEPFVGPYDPCPPICVKTFVIPPNMFVAYQKPGLPQYPVHEALRRGTLWPTFYSPYSSRLGAATE